jgi:hypothetical protein
MVKIKRLYVTSMCTYFVDNRKKKYVRSSLAKKIKSVRRTYDSKADLHQKKLITQFMYVTCIKLISMHKYNFWSTISFSLHALPLRDIHKTKSKADLPQISFRSTIFFSLHVLRLSQLSRGCGCSKSTLSVKQKYYLYIHEYQVYNK